MGGCPFCIRLSNKKNYGSYSEDSDAVFFPPLNPVTPGHMLFVPRRHVRDALEDPELTGKTMQLAVEYWNREWASNAIYRDCNFITSAGSAATQTVFHLHIHLIPRRFEDGLWLPWTGQARTERIPGNTDWDNVGISIRKGT